LHTNWSYQLSLQSILSSTSHCSRRLSRPYIRSAAPCQIHQLQTRFLSKCSTPEPSPVAVHPFPRCGCAGPVATTRWQHGKTWTPFANSFPDPLLGGKQHRKREGMSATLHRRVTTQPPTLVRCCRARLLGRRVKRPNARYSGPEWTV
jgi:hypothetical protein